MSAHTFETLSTELTRALAEQSNIPPRTIARCTLGREKVMVLVEYPLDSASAEPTAKQTLDWLEQYLREQFDTAGLPDEAADLSEEIEEVPVQLYLKHMSEVRPFKMHSFTWKVADGFDDIFGESTTVFPTASAELSLIDSSVDSLEANLALSEAAEQSDAVSSEADSLSSEESAAGYTSNLEPIDLESVDSGPILESPSPQIVSDGTGLPSLSETAVSAEAQPLDNALDTSESVVMLPEGEEERVLSELESNLSLDLETDVDALDADLDSDLADDFGFGLSAGEDVGADESMLGSSADSNADSNADLDLGLDLEEDSTPALIPDPTVNISDALDADLSLGLQPSSSVVSDDATEFSLPGEAPTIESSEFELPTVDLPIVSAVGSEADSSIDFFELPNDEVPVADTGTKNLFEFSSPLDALITEDAETEALTQLDLEGANDVPDNDAFGVETTDVETTGVETTSVETTDLEASALETIDLETLELETIALESSELEMPDENDNSVPDTPAAELLEGRTTENMTVADPLDAFLSAELSPEEQERSEVESSSFEVSSLVNEAPTVENSEAITEDFDIADGPESDWNTSDDLVPEDLDDLSIEATATEATDIEAVDTDVDVEGIDVEETDRLDIGGLDDDLDTDTETSGLEDDLDLLRNEALLENEALLKETSDETLVAPDAPIQDELSQDELSQDELSQDELSQDELETQGELTSDFSDEAYDTDLDSDTEESEDYDLYDYEISDGAEDLEEGEDYVEDEDSAYYLEGVEGEDETLSDFEDVALVDDVEVQRQREQWKQQSKGNPFVIVGAFGFVLAGVLGYVFTRPCTIGSCDRIETAQEKGKEAISSLSAASTAAEVTDSKKELKHAIQMLDPIPMWSSHYDDAQTLLPGYEQQLTDLDLVTEAQAQAYSAAVKSQDPPHPASTWEEVANQWREATSLLSKVPLDSPVRGLAERKLVEYRANLSTILVRIESEAGAEVSLRQAQAAASSATQKTPQADSLEDWEAILADWSTAVENLERIPQGSQAHGEAQKILPEYEEKLLEARSRVEQEQSARRILLRAEDFSTEAKIAEKEEQWTTSVENWSQAVFQLGQIPDSSLAYSDAQSRLVTYTGALGAAENNMQVSMRFAPIEPSFYLICGGSEVQKCTYSVTAGKVRLDLAEGYDAVINESITPPPQRAGLDSSAQLVSQSNQLLQQITLLSTQAQIPVELYDAQGEFVARYRPDLDGFVR